MWTITLVVLSIALMICDKRMAVVEQTRAALSLSLVPLQYVVSWPMTLIDNVRQIITSHDALVKENLDLKASELLLQAQVQRLTAIESENNHLKALVRSSSQVQGKTLIAQLLAIDTDPYVHQVFLDKGSLDNVYVGQPVLDANGVMGQVIEAGPITSRVLLINDPHSGIPVEDTRNGIRAIAVGDSYSNKLRLVNIPQTVDIRPGDVFITSGLGQKYPEGYPVGQVSTVVHDPANSFALITLEPSAHLDQSRQALLVWPSKSRGGRNA